MNFDGNVSCLVAVNGFMDNDFFDKAVYSGSVKLRNVPVFLYGFHPFPRVHRKAVFIVQPLPGFRGLFL